MDKLLLIIKREFLAKVKNKSFIIITILSPVLMVAMVALIIFIQSSSQNEFKNVAFVDNNHVFSEVFENKEHIKYTDLGNLSIQDAKAKVQKGNFYGLLYINKTSNINLYSKQFSFYSESTPSITFISSLENKLESKIRDLKLEKLNLDLDKIKETKTQVDIITAKFSGEESSKMGSILKMVLGGAFGYLIFMFIIIYGNSVMRSVIEEKSNRIIEVIISSVKPFYLLLGKIFGNALAGVLQFVIWIVSAGILMLFLSKVLGVETSSVPNTSSLSPEIQEKMMETTSGTISLVFQEISNLPIATMLLSFLVFFTFGYLLYSSIFAAIGASVDSETDTQQFMVPVMMPLIIAVYAGFSIIENPHGSIAVGFSLFPLTSPIVMLMRIPFGVPFWQLAVSMILLIFTFVGIVYIAAKIYRIGILMYGKKPSYKDIYKWLKL